jgi:hypothetical protein
MAKRGQIPFGALRTMPRPNRRLIAVAAAVVAIVVHADPAAARSARAGRSHVRFHPDWEKHASTRYAAMSSAACMEELSRRAVAFTQVTEAPGVATPLRLPKGVGGVVYRTHAPAHLRDTSPYDIFDCRLALALSDFSRVLRAHDVDEVLLFSAYRPLGKRHPDGDAPSTRHAGGLAIDVHRFGKRGTAGQRVWLDVERDFHGRIGAPACGVGAAPPSPATADARELRSIACEAADQHMFTTILTPSYDRAHRNHVHLEVTPGVRWYLVR